MQIGLALWHLVLLALKWCDDSQVDIVSLQRYIGMMYELQKIAIQLHINES